MAGEPRHCQPDNQSRRNKNMKKITLLALLILAAGVAAANAADAKDNWDKNCAKCHGQDGKGETRMGKKLGIKDYTDAKVQAGFTDEEATKTIKEGKTDKDGNTLMKPVDGLSDDEIKALVAYVRAFKQ
jgi:cytochrome c553